MNQAKRETVGFFDIVTDKQAYMSLTYLMLSFPLGIFYFVFIAIGLSVGIGLIPIFIGIPILYVFMLSLKYFMRFERKMAAVLLGMNIREISYKREKGIGVLVRFKDEFFDVELWKALTYLTFKFVLGILVFTMCVTLISLSIGLTAAPVVYQLVEHSIDNGLIEINGIYFHGILDIVGISASPEQEMFMLMFLGALVGIGSLHIFNKTAYMMGGLLKAMSPAVVKE